MKHCRVLLLCTLEFCVYLYVAAPLKHRCVMHYGYRFDYTANAVDRTPLPRGIPLECLKLMKRLFQQNLISHLPDQMTVNQYQPGHGKNRTFGSFIIS